MYYYNRPIGIYIFISIFALTLIVKIENTGGFTWMDFGLAILYGAMIWGLGNLLWAGVGDIISPYLHRAETFIEYEVASGLDNLTGDIQALNDRNEFQVAKDEFTRNLDKRINNHKLWAKGMSILTEKEESQLRRYFSQRWDAKVNNLVVPSYIEESLMNVLVTRGIVTGIGLTEYGETIIPNRNLVSQELV